jgi:ribonuclease HI
MGLLISIILSNNIEYVSSQMKIKYLGDSELVIKQMNSLYKITTPHIILLNKFCEKLLANTKQLKNIVISFEHILREYNKEADSLSNKGKELPYNTFEISTFN